MSGHRMLLSRHYRPLASFTEELRRKTKFGGKTLWWDNLIYPNNVYCSAFMTPQKQANGHKVDQPALYMQYKFCFNINYITKSTNPLLLSMMLFFLSVYPSLTWPRIFHLSFSCWLRMFALTRDLIIRNSCSAVWRNSSTFNRGCHFFWRLCTLDVSSWKANVTFSTTRASCEISSDAVSQILQMISEVFFTIFKMRNFFKGVSALFLFYFTEKRARCLSLFERECMVAM